MSDAGPAAILTIRGGRESMITVSWAPGTSSRLLVRAGWVDEIVGSRSTSITVDELEQAQKTAYRWAGQIEAGVEPD